MKKLQPLFVIVLIAGCLGCLSCSSFGRVVGPEAAVPLPEKMPAQEMPEGNVERKDNSVEPVKPEGNIENNVELKQPVLGPGTMEFRQRVYAKRLEQWQVLERQMGSLGFQTRPQKWYRCLDEVRFLVNQYAEGYESFAQEKDGWAAAGLFQADISYLESGCAAVMEAGQDSLAGWLGDFANKISVDGSTLAYDFKGNSNSMEMARELLSSLPERRLEPAIRQLFGRSLLQSGQLEAAANLLVGIADRILLRNEECALQQLVADILLATGRVAEARQRYEEMEAFFSGLHGADRWVTEQLAVLDSGLISSKSFAVFLNIMRNYVLLDGRTIPPGMEESVLQLEKTMPDSILALRGRALLTQAENSVLDWVASRLEEADALVELKEFDDALEILATLEGLPGLGNVPGELVREALKKVRYAQSLERETQRMLKEQEMAIKWENALSLLDLQNFDEAIAVFSSLIGTGYEEQARKKIEEASNLSAQLLRRRSSALFVQARKAVGFERKRALLKESLTLLRTVARRYPDAEIIEKVKQNLSYLEDYISRFDPTLLENEGVEEGAAPPVIDSDVEEENLPQ